MFVPSEKRHLPLEGRRVWVCRIGFRKTNRANVDNAILDRNVARVVWHVWVCPKRVTGGTRKVLRHFGFATVFFVLAPVFFLASSAQEV